MTGSPFLPEPGVGGAPLDPIEALSAAAEQAAAERVLADLAALGRVAERDAAEAAEWPNPDASIPRIGLARPVVEPEPVAPVRTGRKPTLEPDEAAFLVTAAAGGDRAAWDALVAAYGGLIWTVARNHRLSAGDAGDVSQTTWLRLVENIDRLSEPSRVGAWLATTARRECLRLLGRAKRTVLSGEELDPDSDRLRLATPEADSALLAAERDEEVRRAFDRLTPRCRDLLQLLLLDPAPSYDEISAALDIPVGSIGPTRGRCLEKLRGIVGDIGITVPSPGSS
jgi:RNA polymerase sigma factor (sigma-70 family)